MTLVVLLILAVIWALYLTSWVRSRAQVRSANTISSFNQHLSVLERARPAGVAAPALHAVDGTPRLTSQTRRRPHDPLVRPPQVRGLMSGAPITLVDARRRRREVLMLLATLAAVSVVPYVVLGGAFAYLALAVNSVLAVYVMLLVRAQKLVEERREKVRYLPVADHYEYEPAFAQYSVR